MRVVFVFVLLVLSTSAGAEPAVNYPVSVPQERFELAVRKGVPILIENRFQLIKARIKLARLKKSDPLVPPCRAAVERAKQAQANGVRPR